MNGIYETCFSDETVKPVVSGKYDFQILLFQIWHLLILVDCRANGKNCKKLAITDKTCENMGFCPYTGEYGSLKTHILILENGLRCYVLN